MESKTNRQLEPFTREELAAMRNHSEDDRLLFLLLTSTGIRASDAIGLTWGEVFLDRQQIEYVEHKSPRRTILPIHAELLSVLSAEHQRRNPRQNEPVLQHSNGKPFTREYLCRRIVALGRRSGVQHAHTHRFRQTFAVELLLRGVDPFFVATLIADALAEGPKSPLWSQLRHTIPAATLSRFANLAGVQEKCNGNRKARY